MARNVEETAKWLLALDMDKFRDEVDVDVRPPRPGNEDTWQVRHKALRSPAVVDRWFTALSKMSKNVDGQLAAKAEDYEAAKSNLRLALMDPKQADRKAALQKEMEELKGSYARSRAGTLRFKTGLDESLIEARALRDQIRDRLYDSVVAEERNRYAARVLELEDAIREHRAQTDMKDLDPEPHDEQLWKVLS